MKKTILTIAAYTIISSLMFTGCNSPAEKVEDAKMNVTEAHSDLAKANDEYLVDQENYRKETTERIAANDKSIAEFNVRIEKEKEEAKANYKNKVAELEQKNSDLKKKMDDYTEEGKEKWESFKREFNHDMEELRLALMDLTQNNTK